MDRPYTSGARKGVQIVGESDKYIVEKFRKNGVEVFVGGRPVKSKS